jgi:predicted DNA-binding transcriptional regulator YafY
MRKAGLWQQRASRYKRWMKTWLTQIFRREKMPVPYQPDSGRRRLFGVAVAAAISTPLVGAQGGGATGLASLPPAQLAVILRDIAFAGVHTDTPTRAEHEKMLDEIARTIPEARDLVTLHRLYRSGQSTTACHPPLDFDIVRLHDACMGTHMISFGYRDRVGKQTQRSVFPIELLYLPTGIRLLAHCALRQDIRMFALENMIAPQVTATAQPVMRHDLVKKAIARKQAEDHEFYTRDA